MLNPFRLLLITDDAGRSAGQLRAIIAQAILGGVTAVQLREKRSTTRQLDTLIRKLLPVCRDASVPLLLNGSLLGRLDLPVDVDGIHFNAGSVLAEARAASPPPPGSEIRLPAGYDFQQTAADAAGVSTGRRLLVGYSAHSFEEARAVAARGVDYVTLSPVFATPSKEGLLPPCGTGVIAATRALLPKLGLVGLGGIDETNAAQVITAGADGVAVIRAIMSSTDPRSAARRLRDVIDAALAERHG